MWHWFGKESRWPPWVFRRHKATSSVELYKKDQRAVCLPVLAKPSAVNRSFSRKLYILLPTLLSAWLGVEPL